MRTMLRWLGSRWFLSFLGVVLLAALIWWFGPFLAVLENWIARAAVIAVMVLVWVAANLVLDARRRRKDKALVEGAVATETDPSALASAEEEAAMRQKLLNALTMLKKASGARGYLYQQPWYVIIGPPGTGKTTALLNSGLRFRWREPMGRRRSRGVGGTRNCDWWFTDEAFLIDTAGRYTTQEAQRGGQSWLDGIPVAAAPHSDASAAQRADRCYSRCRIPHSLTAALAGPATPSGRRMLPRSADASRRFTNSWAFGCRSTRYSPRLILLMGSSISLTTWIGRS